MKLFVGFNVFESVTEPAEINRIREVFGKKMAVIGPKLEGSGVFVGRRSGFMVLSVDSEDEAFTLLAELADFCNLDVVPLASFDTLGRYLAENQL